MSKRIEKRNIKWSVPPAVKSRLEKLAAKSGMGFNEYGAEVLHRTAMAQVTYVKLAPAVKTITRKTP